MPGTSSRVAVGEGADALAGLHLHAPRPGQLVRRALRDDPAAEQDRDAVAHQLHLAEEMRAQHHRDPASSKLPQQVADDAPADRVERARRLVQHQEARRAHERLRDAEPLLHALRHGGDLGVAGVGQAHQLEQLGPLPRAPLGGREVLMEGEQLVRGEPVGESEQLGEVADRRARLGGAGGRALDLGAAFRCARTRPQAIFVRVDFPAPFGPSRPSSSPGATSRSTPPSATVAP